MAGRVVLGWLVFLATQAAASVTVHDVEYEGLTRTAPSVVERELAFTRGAPATDEQLELTLRRLRNLAMFADVQSRVVMRQGKSVLVYTFEERWTLKPVISGQTGGNSYWFILGLSERNFLGRGYFTEALYQNFNGVSGGRLFFEDPRRWTVIAERMVRPRIQNTVQRTRIRGSAVSPAGEQLTELGLGVEGFQDAFYAPLTGAVASLPSPMVGGFIEPWVRIGVWEPMRQLRRGLIAEIRPQFGVTDRQGLYAQVVATVEAARIWQDRWNLLGRVRMGATTSVPAQMEYFAGGLDFARGYPDTFFQSQQFIGTNLDLRFLLVESKWVALSPFVFGDTLVALASGLDPRGGLSAGGGLVIGFPAIADAELRIDVSSALKAPFAMSIGFATTSFY